ncbi:hypothetical protein B0H16DRAFT_1703488 [Mycena metata]|uniref:Uncharacterized protein n=1 Tax=Mycena metata TaxID=1033252 RepID=A0AAD7H4N3_9AGAR|nr:hypothetical protein B0H16DRAFT_1703488 [Mycena metata]
MDGGGQEKEGANPSTPALASNVFNDQTSSSTHVIFGEFFEHIQLSLAQGSLSIVQSPQWDALTLTAGFSLQGFIQYCVIPSIGRSCAAFDLRDLIQFDVVELPEGLTQALKSMIIEHNLNLRHARPQFHPQHPNRLHLTRVILRVELDLDLGHLGMRSALVDFDLRVSLKWSRDRGSRANETWLKTLIYFGFRVSTPFKSLTSGGKYSCTCLQFKISEYISRSDASKALVAPQVIGPETQSWRTIRPLLIWNLWMAKNIQFYKQGEHSQALENVLEAAKDGRSRGQKDVSTYDCEVRILESRRNFNPTQRKPIHPGTPLLFSYVWNSFSGTGLEFVAVNQHLIENPVAVLGTDKSRSVHMHTHRFKASSSLYWIEDLICGFGSPRARRDQFLRDMRCGMELGKGKGWMGETRRGGKGKRCGGGTTRQHHARAECARSRVWAQLGPSTVACAGTGAHAQNAAGLPEHEFGAACNQRCGCDGERGSGEGGDEGKCGALDSTVCAAGAVWAWRDRVREGGE